MQWVDNKQTIEASFVDLYDLVRHHILHLANETINHSQSLFQKDKQWSGTATIRSHILPSKPKGKEINTFMDNGLQEARTVNRMNSSFPDKGHSAT